MRSISLSLLALLFLFPACKKSNEHPYLGNRQKPKTVQQPRSPSEPNVELVDRKSMTKGVACLAGAPVVAGVGLCGGLMTLAQGAALVGVGAVAAPLGIVVAGGVGAAALFVTGCSYLSKQCKAKREHDKTRGKVGKCPPVTKNKK